MSDPSSPLSLDSNNNVPKVPNHVIPSLSHPNQSLLKSTVATPNHSPNSSLVQTPASTPQKIIVSVDSLLPSGSGSVFITLADIRRLSSDTRLIPSDPMFYSARRWFLSKPPEAQYFLHCRRNASRPKVWKNGTWLVLGADLGGFKSPMPIRWRSIDSNFCAPVLNPQYMRNEDWFAKSPMYNQFSKSFPPPLPRYPISSVKSTRQIFESSTAQAIWKQGGAPPIDFYSGSHPIPFDYPNHLVATYILNIDVGRSRDAYYFTECIRTYLHQACNDVLQAMARGYKPLNGRIRPLISLPLIGTGFGGARSHMGQVIAHILPILYLAAESYQMDIVLTTNEHSVFAVINRVRLTFPTSSLSWKLWTIFLSSKLRKKAKRLAELAAQQKLVIFFGAGVSKAAGLPLWGELLKSLAIQLNFDESQVKDMASLDFLDQASLLAKRAYGEFNLQIMVPPLIDAPCYGLLHAAMASLPINEFITPNYDRLFSLASVAVGIPVDILPYHASNVLDHSESKNKAFTQVLFEFKSLILSDSESDEDEFQVRTPSPSSRDLNEVRTSVLEQVKAAGKLGQYESPLVAHGGQTEASSSVSTLPSSSNSDQKGASDVQKVIAGDSVSNQSKIIPIPSVSSNSQSPKTTLSSQSAKSSFKSIISSPTLVSASSGGVLFGASSVVANSVVAHSAVSNSAKSNPSTLKKHHSPPPNTHIGSLSKSSRSSSFSSSSSSSSSSNTSNSILNNRTPVNPLVLEKLRSDSRSEKKSFHVDNKSLIMSETFDDQRMLKQFQKRWCLKLHGDILHPEDIVLTRESYLRSDQSALMGVVQASLITKHLLFLGFALQDPHFHQVLFAVRQATGGRRHDYATALMLFDDPMMEQLWEGNVDLVSMQNGAEPSVQQSARRLEIFMDFFSCIATLRSSNQHLLDDKFSSVLTNSEEAFVKWVRKSMESMPVEAIESSAFQTYLDYLSQLGLTGQESHQWFVKLKRKQEAAQKSLQKSSENSDAFSFSNILKQRSKKSIKLLKKNTKKNRKKPLK